MNIKQKMNFTKLILASVNIKHGVRNAILKKNKHKKEILDFFSLIKFCKKCNKLKHITHFSKNPSSGDLHRNTCKQCANNNLIKYNYAVSVIYKTCNNCNKIKKYTEFSIEKTNKDGLRNECKLCRKKKKNNTQNIFIKRKKCRKCGELKDINKFGTLKTSKDGHRYKCKECRKIETIKRKNKKQKYDLQYAKRRKIDHNSIPASWESKIKTDIEKYENIRKSKNNFIEIQCAYCGKWYIPIRVQLYNRLLSINRLKGGESRLYCSNECKQACPTYNQRIYPKDYKPSTSREVQPQLRQMVFERDNWTCQKCNVYKDDLEVPIHCHHIDPVSQNPIESADVDNCITLCKNCHKKVHQLPDCGYIELHCI
jgi:hypothetical protein